MTKRELDSLTVVRDRQGRIEIVNSSGHVGYYRDRDDAYREVRRLRSTRRAALIRRAAR